MTAPLQDWRYDDLVRAGLSLVPAYAPAWTDHNASDPGITLVELLAYFTELLVYRLGRVTPQAKLQFLRLLEGSPQASAPLADIDQAIARAVGAMSRTGCAVTAADFTRLAVAAAQAHLGAGHAVDALCLPGVLPGQTGQGRQRSDPRSNVSVILLPQADLDARAMARLCDAVLQELTPRCLLTTGVQVAGPTLMHVGLALRLFLRPGARRQAVLDAIAAELRAPAAPWRTAVRITDIIELIDNVDGVDHVENVILSTLNDEPDRVFDAGSGIGLQIAVHSTPGIDARLASPQRVQRDDAGMLSSITLQPWEVVRLHLMPALLEVIEPQANDGVALR